MIQVIQGYSVMKAPILKNKTSGAFNVETHRSSALVKLKKSKGFKSKKKVRFNLKGISIRSQSTQDIAGKESLFPPHCARHTFESSNYLHGFESKNPCKSNFVKPVNNLEFENTNSFLLKTKNVYNSEASKSLNSLQNTPKTYPPHAEMIARRKIIICNNSCCILLPERSMSCFLFQRSMDVGKDSSRRMALQSYKGETCISTDQLTENNPKGHCMMSNVRQLVEDSLSGNEEHPEIAFEHLATSIKRIHISPGVSNDPSDASHLENYVNSKDSEGESNKNVTPVSSNTDMSGSHNNNGIIDELEGTELEFTPEIRPMNADSNNNAFERPPDQLNENCENVPSDHFHVAEQDTHNSPFRTSGLRPESNFSGGNGESLNMLPDSMRERGDNVELQTEGQLHAHPCAEDENSSEDNSAGSVDANCNSELHHTASRGPWNLDLASNFTSAGGTYEYEYVLTRENNRSKCSSANVSIVTQLDDAKGVFYQCPVLNCGMTFTSQERLLEHLSQMQHSPCSPVATIIDGVIPETCCFLCPLCGHTFNEEHDCLEHMLAQGHSQLMSPLPSPVFACPQCLCFFPSTSSTLEHMTNVGHHTAAFTFPDDIREPNRCTPIPVPHQVVAEVLYRCSQVDPNIICQNCQKKILKPADLQFHLKEGHVIMSKCCKTPVDVFSTLITDQACAECHQFIYDGLSDDSQLCIHTSCPLQGPILSHGAVSLSEFVYRCGISEVCLGTEHTYELGPNVRSSFSATGKSQAEQCSSFNVEQSSTNMHQSKSCEHHLLDVPVKHPGLCSGAEETEESLTEDLEYIDNKSLDECKKQTAVDESSSSILQGSAWPSHEESTHNLSHADSCCNSAAELSHTSSNHYISSMDTDVSREFDLCLCYGASSRSEDDSVCSTKSQINASPHLSCSNDLSPLKTTASTCNGSFTVDSYFSVDGRFEIPFERSHLGIPCVCTNGGVQSEDRELGTSSMCSRDRIPSISSMDNILSGDHGADHYINMADEIDVIYVDSDSSIEILNEKDILNTKPYPGTERSSEPSRSCESSRSHFNHKVSVTNVNDKYFAAENMLGQENPPPCNYPEGSGISDVLSMRKNEKMNSFNSNLDKKSTDNSNMIIHSVGDIFSASASQDIADLENLSIQHQAESNVLFPCKQSDLRINDVQTSSHSAPLDSPFETCFTDPTLIHRSSDESSQFQTRMENKPSKKGNGNIKSNIMASQKSRKRRATLGIQSSSKKSKVKSICKRSRKNPPTRMPCDIGTRNLSTSSSLYVLVSQTQGCNAVQKSMSAGAGVLSKRSPMSVKSSCLTHGTSANLIPEAESLYNIVRPIKPSSDDQPLYTVASKGPEYSRTCENGSIVRKALSRKLDVVSVSQLDKPNTRYSESLSLNHCSSEPLQEESLYNVNHDTDHYTNMGDEVDVIYVDSDSSVEILNEKDILNTKPHVRTGCSAGLSLNHSPSLALQNESLRNVKASNDYSGSGTLNLCSSGPFQNESLFTVVSKPSKFSPAGLTLNHSLSHQLQVDPLHASNVVEQPNNDCSVMISLNHESSHTRQDESLYNIIGKPSSFVNDNSQNFLLNKDIDQEESLYIMLSKPHKPTCHDSNAVSNVFQRSEKNVPTITNMSHSDHCLIDAKCAGKKQTGSDLRLVKSPYAGRRKRVRVRKVKYSMSSLPLEDESLYDVISKPSCFVGDDISQNFKSSKIILQEKSSCHKDKTTCFDNGAVLDVCCQQYEFLPNIASTSNKDTSLVHAKCSVEKQIGNEIQEKKAPFACCKNRARVRKVKRLEAIHPLQNTVIVKPLKALAKKPDVIESLYNIVNPCPTSHCQNIQEHTSPVGSDHIKKGKDIGRPLSTLEQKQTATVHNNNEVKLSNANQFHSDSQQVIDKILTYQNIQCEQAISKQCLELDPIEIDEKRDHFTIVNETVTLGDACFIATNDRKNGLEPSALKHNGVNEMDIEPNTEGASDSRQALLQLQTEGQEATNCEQGQKLRRCLIRPNDKFIVVENVSELLSSDTGSKHKEKVTTTDSIGSSKRQRGNRKSLVNADTNNVSGVYKRLHRRKTLHHKACIRKSKHRTKATCTRYSSAYFANFPGTSRAFLSRKAIKSCDKSPSKSKYPSGEMYTGQKQAEGGKCPQPVAPLMLRLDGPRCYAQYPSPCTVAKSLTSPAVPRFSPLKRLMTPKMNDLLTMERIVFADLENFMIFKCFQGPWLHESFLWGFISARPNTPFHLESHFLKYPLYKLLKTTNNVHISTDIGTSKDAVDFAMALTIAKLDDRLPHTIPFFIVSGDKGFLEVENQMRASNRTVRVISPMEHVVLTHSHFVV